MSLTHILKSPLISGDFVLNQRQFATGIDIIIGVHVELVNSTSASDCDHMEGRVYEVLHCSIGEVHSIFLFVAVVILV